MGVAITLQEYLDKQGVQYEVLVHKRTACSTQAALASQVPRECLAKGVLLKHRKGYLLAVVPASREARLEELGNWLQQPVCLATEEEVSTLFPDCERAHDDCRCEPRALVYVEGLQFTRLVESMPHAQFSTPASLPTP